MGRPWRVGWPQVGANADAKAGAGAGLRQEEGARAGGSFGLCLQKGFRPQGTISSVVTRACPIPQAQTLLLLEPRAARASDQPHKKEPRSQVEKVSVFLIENVSLYKLGQRQIRGKIRVTRSRSHEGQRDAETPAPSSGRHVTTSAEQPGKSPLQLQPQNPKQTKSEMIQTAQLHESSAAESRTPPAHRRVQALAFCSHPRTGGLGTEPVGAAVGALIPAVPMHFLFSNAREV